MPSAEKTRANLAQLVQNGEYYGAHQKYRTTAARLCNIKAPAPTAGSLAFDDKAQEAAELLWEGARNLLEREQSGSGTDLALYLIEVWNSRGVVCGDAERAKIRQLLVLVGGAGTWRKAIADAAVAWTSKTGTCPAGDLTLHHIYGELLFKDKDYVSAELHLVSSGSRDSARSLAALLLEWSKLDPQPVQNLGRYAARGALSFLENSNILAAHTCFDTFVGLALTAYPELLISRPSTTCPITVTTLPSLNFLQLAVRSCQVGVGEAAAPAAGAQPARAGMGKAAWQALVGRYEREVPWLRSQDAKETREALNELFFGMKSAKGGNDMMANLMSSLFGGGGSGPAAAGRPQGRSSPAPRVTSPGLD